jgi:ferredoxin
VNEPDLIYKRPILHEFIIVRARARKRARSRNIVSGFVIARKVEVGMNTTEHTEKIKNGLCVLCDLCGLFCPFGKKSFYIHFLSS